MKLTPEQQEARVKNQAKNLQNQVDAVFRRTNEGSFKTVQRYKAANERFCDFLGENTKLKNFRNVEVRHVRAYVEHLQSIDCLPSYKETEALYSLIDAQENDLRNMEEPPDKKLHYDRYFFINRSKDGKLAYRRNNKAIDEQLSLCGYFLIAETDFKKTTAEILEIYRNRDVVEKSFDSLKNELDMKRLHTWTSETAQGKLFVSFISLIVRSYMLNRLSDYMRKNGFTLKKILLELDKIKCFAPNSAHSPRPLNPQTKTQREIYTSLALDTEECIG